VQASGGPGERQGLVLTVCRGLADRPSGIMHWAVGSGHVTCVSDEEEDAEPRAGGKVAQVMTDPCAEAGQDRILDGRRLPLVAEGATDGPEMVQCHENGARGSHRRVIMTVLLQGGVRVRWSPLPAARPLR
jgi:hypothetical protein